MNDDAATAGGKSASVPRLAQLFDGLTSGLNGLGTLGIVGLMLVINLDVFSRWLAGAPIAGVAELVKLTIVAVVFLQAPHTLASGRLTYSEIFVAVLQKRSAVAARALRGSFCLVGAWLFAMVVLGAWPQLVKAWERGEYAGAQGVFTIPTWPVKAIVVIGSVMMVLEFLRQAARLFSGRSDHDAV